VGRRQPALAVAFHLGKHDRIADLTDRPPFPRSIPLVFPLHSSPTLVDATRLAIYLFIAKIGV